MTAITIETKPVKSRKRASRRQNERQRHFQVIAVTGWETQIVKPAKEILVEEGIVCYHCGYPLRGKWCNRCQDIGASSLISNE
jgi:hypothetical protein